MLHVYDVCLLAYGSKQINMVALAFREIVYLTTPCIKSRLSFILRTNTMSVPNDPTTTLPIEKKISWDDHYYQPNYSYIGFASKALPSITQ